MTPYSDGRFKTFAVSQEIGRNGYGVYEEYTGSPGAAECIAGTTSHACTTESAWHDGDRFSNGATGGSLVTGRVSEVCVAANHDPEGDTDRVPITLADRGGEVCGLYNSCSARGFRTGGRRRGQWAGAGPRAAPLFSHYRTLGQHAGQQDPPSAHRFRLVGGQRAGEQGDSGMSRAPRRTRPAFSTRAQTDQRRLRSRQGRTRSPVDRTEVSSQENAVLPLTPTRRPTRPRRMARSVEDIHTPAL